MLHISQGLQGIDRPLGIQPMDVKIGVNKIYVLWITSTDWLPITLRMTVSQVQMGLIHGYWSSELRDIQPVPHQWFPQDA